MNRGDGKPYGPFCFEGSYDINDPNEDGYRTSRIIDLEKEEFEILVNIDKENIKKVDEGYEVEFKSGVAFGKTPYTYNWDFGDEEQSDGKNPTHIYNEKGKYPVTLTVTDDFGNFKTVIKEIQVKQNTAFTFFRFY